MFDHIVAGGCSLAYGMELQNRDDRFTNLIARHYNANIYDFSGSGYSNEAIAHNVINGTLGLLSSGAIDPNKTLAVINWSYIDRLVYYNSEVKGWFSMFPHRTNMAIARKRSRFNLKKLFDQYMHPSEVQMFYNNHSDPLHLLYHFSSIVHKTQTFLEHHNIRYVFSPSCKYTIELLDMGKTDFDFLYSNVYKKEGFTSFKNVLDDIRSERILKTAFMDYSKENNLKIGLGNHPLEDAHKAFGNVLIKFIGDLYDKEIN